MEANLRSISDNPGFDLCSFLPDKKIFGNTKELIETVVRNIYNKVQLNLLKNKIQHFE